MDGHFVSSIVMGPPAIESVRKHVPEAFMDCHMMVSEPLKVRTKRVTADMSVDPTYR